MCGVGEKKVSAPLGLQTTARRNSVLGAHHNSGGLHAVTYCMVHPWLKRLKHGPSQKTLHSCHTRSLPALQSHPWNQNLAYTTDPSLIRPTQSSHTSLLSKTHSSPSYFPSFFSCIHIISSWSYSFLHLLLYEHHRISIL